MRQNHLSSARLTGAILAISAAAAFLLCGYEFIRSTSTSLYIGALGANRLPYGMFTGAVLTLLVLHAYGLILSRVGPRQTLLATSLLSAMVIALCYLGVRAGSSAATLITYGFREAYIVVLVEQYWSFINSTLKERHARCFNGIICGAGSLGAIGGGVATRVFADQSGTFFIGTEVILLLAAASLLPAALCSEVAYRLAGEPERTTTEKIDALGLRLLTRSSYLSRIGVVIVLTQIVSTVLDLAFFQLVEAVLPVKDARTAFIGSFYAKLNFVAGILQFAATPVLLGVFGPRWILPAIPLVHITTAAALGLRPSLATGGVAYLLFKALDYSLFRAGKEILYMPLSFDARYRAKEVIDAFGYRAAKGISAALASAVRLTVGAVPLLAYPLTAIAAAANWLIVTTGLVRDYHRFRHGQLNPRE
ncbi:MAG: Npt1/Npt2 family nucleotide transporter [Kiritimatiellia bacterium]